MKNFLRFFFLTTFCFVALLGTEVFAAVTVSPLVIEVEAEPRDTEVFDITLTNSDSRPIRLYATVNEITLGEGGALNEFVPASMGDRTTSVTSWLEISRARIDIQPGETKEIPLTVRINPNTPAGEYHAFIGFASGPNRDDIEAKVLAGQGMGVVVRIAVGGKQEEFLRLVSFTTDRFSIKPDVNTFTYTLENTGDVALSPKGDVIIYDSRGRELQSIALGTEGGEEIAPGERKTYTKELPFINRLGKNKAFLSLEYGSAQKAALYDTNFYYSIPWFYLIVAMLLLATVLIALVVLIRKSAASEEYFETNEAQDVPMFVGKKREHNEYEHDINLKNKSE